MKKAVSIMLFFALFLLLAGCKEVPVSESSEPLNSNNVIKWFDCLNGDEMAWDGVKEYDLDEFSGVTFSLASRAIRRLCRWDNNSAL